MAGLGSVQKIDISKMLSQYNVLLKSVANLVACASNSSNAQPGKFLLIQFQLSQATQIGDSISNLLSSLNSCASNAIRNFKG